MIIDNYAKIEFPKLILIIVLSLSVVWFTYIIFHDPKENETTNKIQIPKEATPVSITCENENIIENQLIYIVKNYKEGNVTTKFQIRSSKFDNKFGDNLSYHWNTIWFGSAPFFQNFKDSLEYGKKYYSHDSSATCTFILEETQR